MIPLPSPDAPYLAASALVEQVLLCLHDSGRPAPTRYYVSPGQPAYDCCDALIVEVGRVKIQSVTPARPQQGLPCGGECWVAEATVHLLRCVPTIDDHGQPPPHDALDRAARGLHADGTALLSCLSCDNCEDTLCQLRALQGYEVRGPMGACAAVVARLNLPLTERAPV